MTCNLDSKVGIDLVIELLHVFFAVYLSDTGHMVHHIELGVIGLLPIVAEGVDGFNLKQITCRSFDI